MPIAAIAALLVLAAGLAYRLLQEASRHPGPLIVVFLIVLGIGGAVLAILYAVVRGASRHVLIANNSQLNARKMPRALPGVPERPLTRISPAGDEEEDEAPDPEPADLRTCENKPCGRELGDAPCMIEVLPFDAPEDAEGERHWFCSRSCLDAWQEEDQVARLLS